MFAAAHLTQGLYPTKLIVYFLFGLGLAVIVWRTGSLLPAMVVHSFGDLVFFTAVWPLRRRPPAGHRRRRGRLVLRGLALIAVGRARSGCSPSARLLRNR